jgi:uncharacterized protein
MRTKFYPIAVAILMVVFLAGCGPVATLLPSASAQNQPAAPAGGIIQNVPVVQTNPAAPAVQAVAPGTRSLTVTGTGRTTLTPDLAYVNIGVHSENASVSEAMAANKSQTQKVVDAIKAQGVDAKDIQTTNYNVYPMQKSGPNGEAQGQVYSVDNTVFVTVRDLNKLGGLLDAAVQNGANNINGIQFDVADKTTALSSARKDAVKNAADLAKELADASGVGLGQILSISVNTSNVPLPMYSGYGMGGGGVSASSPVPVSPGQMILSEDVTVVYEIK